MRFYKEALECINGGWQTRTLQCSSCFDAPDEGPSTPEVKKLLDVGTERGGQFSFDCLHFQSRPQLCAEYVDAQKNCRIACRTCEQMLMQFKVKAVQEDKEGVKHPQKWLKKKLKLLESFRREITEMKQFKVAKRVKKFEEHF